MQVQLTATWSRADQVYRARGPWAGKSIYAMALDLRAAADRARAFTRRLLTPVGDRFPELAGRLGLVADVEDGKVRLSANGAEAVQFEESE